MKKESKQFGKVIEILLIILTVISFIISILEYTNMIYNMSYDTMNLNKLLTSTPFSILLWVDNILIYVVSIFYIIDTIQQKKNMRLKFSFCFFSICTTIVVQTILINTVASLFGIF